MHQRRINPADSSPHTTFIRLVSEFSSHQSLEVCQVNVAILVHFHHLNFHARHLSAGWVGAVGGFRDQTDLEQQENYECRRTDSILIKGKIIMLQQDVD